MVMLNRKTIPVVDLFAGPGGLGEGFSAFQTESGRRPFKIVLSIEKDRYAHQTLVLRSFFRQFEPGATPKEYYEYLRSEEQSQSERWKRLEYTYPKQAEQAKNTALLAELGVHPTHYIREHIDDAICGCKDFILLGGPPCQAYSIIGRSRNNGNPKYSAKEDKRQRLYVEYLQVLADHHPAVFIMENVKGLLSATLENQRIFERMLDDLRSPCEAITRERREIADGRRRTRYDLFSLVQTDSGHDEDVSIMLFPPDQTGNDHVDDLRKFIVRMERYGIPQARHRLIIVGVRADLHATGIIPLQESQPVNVSQVISDLPEVRSGISRQEDTLDRWRECIQQIRSYPFMNDRIPVSDPKWAIRKELEDALKSLCTKRLSRGGEFVKCRPRTTYRPDWFIDPLLEGVCNHRARLHMQSDLHRYLYAACYARTKSRSPDLRDFPLELFPNHQNAHRSAQDGTFDDRFHVQLSDRPSTTVTSHLAKDGHYFIHPDPAQCRSMTVREVARLQTFPDNYFFCGPRTAQYIQVGNAVPPLLANKIAASVFKLLVRCGIAD